MKFGRIREIAIDTATVIAAISAVIVMAVFVYDRFFTSSRISQREARSPLKVSNWREYAVSGHRIGQVGAPVTIVEFGDYECPACFQFEKPVEAVLAAHPRDVALVFRHWPLSIHRFAYPAARAAECASDQGRFEQFHRLLYAKQDSLGLIPFDEIAARSGVRDVASFRRCNTSAKKVPAIEADMAGALRLGGPGTPTILLDSIRLASIPDSSELEKLIRQELRLR